MNILEEKKIDFGYLKLVQKKYENSSGIVFYQLDFTGRYDGYQNGPSGKSFFYLEKLLPQTKRVIYNLTHTEFLSDIAYRQLLKYRRINNENGGFLLLAAPKPWVAEMLDISETQYCKTLKEAYEIIERI